MVRHIGCSMAARAVLLLLAALTLLNGARVSASEPPWAEARQPFQPHLLVNNNDVVCQGFQDSARRAYLSPAQLLDLYPFLPAAARPVVWQPLALPFEGWAHGDEFSITEVDLKGDGHPAVAMRRVNASSWQGAVYSAYLFASRQALDDAIAAAAAVDAKSLEGSAGSGFETLVARAQRFYPTANSPSARDSIQSWSWNELLAFHDGYYFLDQGNDFSLQSASVVNVYRLTADRAPAVTCSLALMPEDFRVALQNVAALPSFLRVLTTIGDGGPDCGTMHSSWTHGKQAEAAVYRAGTRPWAVAPPPTATYYTYSSRVEDFLARWGEGDPWVRREYLTFTEHRLAAAQALSGYFAARFGLPAKDAQSAGKTVLDHLLAMHLLIPQSFSRTDTGDVPEPAVAIDRPQALQQLLARDNDHERPNQFGKTLLMYAAHLNRLDAVQTLLAAGANANARTGGDPWSCSGASNLRNDRTPLMYAAENASFALIAALIKAGANTDAVDSGGQGIADYLARNPRLRSAGLSPPVNLQQVLAELEKHPDTGKPSFACTGTLSRVEQAVCDDPVAALFDRELSANYQLWKAAAADKAAVQSEQQAWLRRRNESCSGAGDDADLRLCLEERLRARSRYIEHRLEEGSAGGLTRSPPAVPQ